MRAPDLDPLRTAPAVPMKVSACRLAKRAAEALRALARHADLTRIVVHAQLAGVPAVRAPRGVREGPEG